MLLGLDIEEVHSSPYRRCVDTITPFARRAALAAQSRRGSTRADLHARSNRRLGRRLEESLDGFRFRVPGWRILAPSAGAHASRPRCSSRPRREPARSRFHRTATRSVCCCSTSTPRFTFEHACAMRNPDVLRDHVRRRDSALGHGVRARRARRVCNLRRDDDRRRRMPPARPSGSALKSASSRLMRSGLPIDEVLAPLRAGARERPQRRARSAARRRQEHGRAARAARRAVGCVGQRIVMLEPRRLAARAVAARMAATLGESVGDTVGYRMRLETRVSKRTRIEVVTEGVFTRMLQSDPALAGIGARAVRRVSRAQSQRRRRARVRARRAAPRRARATPARDVGHARRRESRRSLGRRARDRMRRPRAFGRHPLRRQGTTGAAGRARGRAARRRRCARRAARARGIDTAICCCSFPARARSGACKRACGRRVSRTDVDVLPLYGELPPGEQDAALALARAGRRKVVLATNIAETSLTIEGVRVVVDSRARAAQRVRSRQRHEPAHDAAHLARFGRAARRPRGPHGARRVLAAVGRERAAHARGARAGRDHDGRSRAARAGSCRVGHRRRDLELARRAAGRDARRRPRFAAAIGRTRRGRPRDRARPRDARARRASAPRAHAAHGARAWGRARRGRARRAASRERDVLRGGARTPDGTRDRDSDVRSRLDVLRRQANVRRRRRPRRARARAPHGACIPEATRCARRRRCGRIARARSAARVRVSRSNRETARGRRCALSACEWPRRVVHEPGSRSRARNSSSPSISTTASATHASCSRRRFVAPICSSTSRDELVERDEVAWDARAEAVLARRTRAARRARARRQAAARSAAGLPRRPRCSRACGPSGRTPCRGATRAAISRRATSSSAR